MNKVGTQIVDPYDDNFGLLKKFFNDKEMPGFIKKADIMNQEDLNLLPDHAFALVLVGGEKPLRKYACIDKAHTAVNAMYFLEKKASLPEKARTVAAENIVRACAHFQLVPPTPLVKEAKSDKILIKSDGPIITTKRTKKAELTGTSLMPIDAPTSRAKLASIMGSPYVELELEEDPFIGKVAEYDPGSHVLDPNCKLASYDHVSRAVRFFEENGKEMHPRIRHEVCVKIASRANKLGVPLDTVIQKYGSLTYASPFEFNTAVEMRKRVWGDLGNEAGPTMLDKLIEKRASMEPSIFAEALSELDIATGVDRYWDEGLCDPWLTTFGKIAQEDWKWMQGNDYLNEEDLRRLVEEGQDVLTQKFGEDVAQGLRKNPIQIFSSLPLNSKIAISRMAQQQRSGL
jgi:hypothetical protein